MDGATGLFQKLTTPVLLTPPIRSRDSLPVPPTGMEWVLSNTGSSNTNSGTGSDDVNAEKKEWRLIKAAINTTTTTTELPELITEHELDHDHKIIPQSPSRTISVVHVVTPVTPCKATTATTMSPYNRTAANNNNNMIIDQSSLLSLLSSKPTLLPHRQQSHNSIGSGSLEQHHQQQQQYHQAVSVDDAWELLSDRISTSSNQTPTVILHQTTIKASTNSSGSVRSLSSMENYYHSSSNDFGTNGNNNNNFLSVLEGGGDGCGNTSNNQNHSIPYKIQRTTSSSTIDSSEQYSSSYIGPLGKGILGVDYIEHVILPTDTLQGICIAYKISSTQLKLANNFSGNSLLLAPSKLVIPISKQALRSGYIRIQDTDHKEYKIHALLAEFPDFSMIEAKAYLELADWKLKDAIRSAKDDHEWELEQNDDDNGAEDQNSSMMREYDYNNNNNNNKKDATSRLTGSSSRMLKSGEIRIIPKLNHIGEPIGFHTKGAGILHQEEEQNDNIDNDTTNANSRLMTHTNASPHLTTLPLELFGKSDNDTATLNTTIPPPQQQHHDIYAQHNNFGVELQSLPTKQ